MNSPNTCWLKNVDLFYGDQNIKIYRSEIQDKTIRLFAKRSGTRSKCPSCMKCSGSMRSSYVRTLADMPLAANSVLIMLKVRRFACKNPACEKPIFSERHNSLIEPYSRRTSRASKYLKKLFIELSASKGAYFSKILNIPVSNNTCLRMVKSMAMPTNKKLHCIGIDDWAKRKGMNYGTIIVDPDTGCPIDLLDSRNSNLSQVSKTIHAVTEPKKPLEYFSKTNLDPGNNVNKNIKQTVSSAMIEKREKLVQMTRMKKNGHSISEISRKTQTDRMTVKRYLANGIP